MTTIAVPRRRSDNLAQRWSRTGGDRARPEVPSRHRSKPAIATLNHSLNHQAKLLLPARRRFDRVERLRAPALAPSASAKSP